MKSLLKNNSFRIGVLSLVCFILIATFLRVPTRLFVTQFNAHTNLPVGLLEKGVDWSDYTVEGGFGMIRFSRETETGYISYDVSNWPDAIFGSNRVDYIICRDSSIVIYHFSVGDGRAEAEMILRKNLFRPSGNEHQFVRNGIVITLFSENNNDVISEIRISATGTNIFGIVY
jgi:hypothetical protein